VFFLICIVDVTLIIMYASSILTCMFCNNFRIKVFLYFLFLSLICDLLVYFIFKKLRFYIDNNKNLFDYKNRL